MEVKVINHTIDKLTGEQSELSLSEQAVILAGREAGICYGSDNYFSNAIKNMDTALKRAQTIIKSGHHSPFDHYSIGLEIIGIPKILVMLINSVEFYTTSEKSARYTVMHPDTDKEQIIYNKWTEKFQEIITAEYPDIVGKDCEKLALENARYMISVFTPTSMGYTTTFRQLSYMANWLSDLVPMLIKSDDAFNSKLAIHCAELRDHFIKLTGGIVKSKTDEAFTFLRKQYGKDDWKQPDKIGEVYQLSYLGSFASLAQAHRHRTIHYEMEFNASSNYGCYIPLIIRNNEELCNEWISDFESIKGSFPQCTLVKIVEQGIAKDFLGKCYERLCGRAQLEIAQQTKKSIQKFIENKQELTEYNQKKFEAFMHNGEVCAKCGVEGYTCTEPCRWGVKLGLDRKI